MGKITNCKVCNKEIASSAIICPECGAKVKKPIYKKWWFWVIIVFAIIIIGANMGNSDTPQQTGSNQSSTSESVKPETSKPEETVTYEEFTVDQLVDDLTNNALSAEKKYKDKYLLLTGKLNVIDSDGEYISLSPVNGQFSLTTVTCYLKTDEQRQKVMTLSKDDTLKVKVKIKSIGEVLGFSADIKEFVE